ncbi:MAG TPA: hypothetical protein VKP68_20095 [Ramlibacter sp.]|nr:hypothetical protein [Ramlibacter sp.]
MTRRQPDADDRSELADALRKGLLIGSAFLLLALPPIVDHSTSRQRSPPSVPLTHSRLAVHLADFKNTIPTPEAREMADWVASSDDNQKRAFVIVDKKDAKVYVFDPQGHLKDAAPALLGEAVGDDSAPGIGDKPLAQVLPQEKTTPAGRFVAEAGMSTRGEDVVWVDYDAAVSMHRVLNVKERLAALSSPTNADNRMSFGCINLPPQFYEKVLRPTVDAEGAVIYILPETRPLQQTFASFYDVTQDLAQH